MIYLIVAFCIVYIMYLHNKVDKLERMNGLLIDQSIDEMEYRYQETEVESIN